MPLLQGLARITVSNAAWNASCEKRRRLFKFKQGEFMKRSVLAIAITAAMLLTAGAAFAQKGQGAPKGPKAPKTSAQGPKTTRAANTTRAPKSTTRGPKKTTPAAAKTSTTTVAGKGNKRTTTTSTTTTTTTAPVAGTTVTLTPVQQKLQRNTNLASKLEGRLPAGTNLMTAAEGFRNLGQFVAAVNVSNNLDIPFTTLKARMVDDRLSLGQAIQSVRRDANVTTEVRRAEADANRIIADSERTVAKPKAKRKDGGQ
jgi:hypothetical protein